MPKIKREKTQKRNRTQKEVGRAEGKKKRGENKDVSKNIRKPKGLGTTVKRSRGKKRSGVRRRESTKMIRHTMMLEDEISKRGYIYGTMKELSELLDIPCTTLYKILSKKNHFFSDKIKNGRNVYYFITLGRKGVR